MRWTEISLTLGRWGGAPVVVEGQKRVVRTLARWAKVHKSDVRVECYVDHPDDLIILQAIQEVAAGGQVKQLVRLEPRSDRFQRCAELGVREVVFEIPASRTYAQQRFASHGIDRTPEFAARQADTAALHGLDMEIALTDICRAEPGDVAAIVDRVLHVLEVRNRTPRWRLVDSTGLGDPLSGGRLPHSLAAWIRWFEKEFGIAADRISVQGSDLLGMALPNTLSGVRAHAEPVCSLFGLGQGTGWAPTELALMHMVDKPLDLRQLIKLKEALITPGKRRDEYRPGLGARAWELPAETSPDDMDMKEHLLPFHPGKVSGYPIEPLLTSLSGKAGLLHLIHRNNADVHIDTEDPDVEVLYEKLNEQFRAGRAVPVSWAEIREYVQKKGIAEKYRDEA